MLEFNQHGKSRRLNVTGLNDPEENIRPEDRIEEIVAPFWKSMGDALLESSPRPVRTADEMVSQPVGKRTRQAPRKRIAQPRPASSRMPRWMALALVAVALAMGAVLGSHLAPSAPVLPEFHYVRFTLQNEQATSVAVAGDFNNWNHQDYQMAHRMASGLWELWLRVPTGRHRYVFVVDNSVRIPDPASAETVPDGRGGLVSVLHVPAPNAKAAAISDVE